MKKVIINLIILTLLFSACQKKEVTTIPIFMPQEFNISNIPIQKAQVGDIEVAYKKFGAGAPLVLIMGYSGTMDLWPTQALEKLAKQNTVVIFDNRGMGQTSAGIKEFTIDQFSDDTLGLIEALNLENPNILAWSMGTIIALDLALNNPEKINKLILYAADCGGKEAILPSTEVMQKLIDTSGTPQEIGMRLISIMFPSDWTTANPNPQKYMPRVTEQSNPESMKKQGEAMAKWAGVCKELTKIQNETLLITGTDDILTPPANSDMLLKGIKNATLIEINNTGHGLIFQIPEIFADYVQVFLNN